MLKGMGVQSQDLSLVTYNVVFIPGKLLDVGYFITQNNLRFT